MEFFIPFKKIKGVDDNHLREIYQDVQIKLTSLRDTEYDLILLYTVTLSSLISLIRNVQFNQVVKDIIRRVRINHSQLKENKVQLELDKLYMRNNENISILYSISYLDALAESFNFKKVSRTCKIQKTKYINKIVKLILLSY